MHRLQLLLISTLATGSIAAAQPCPAHPHTLAELRDCARPLLVFSPAPDNPRLQQQVSAFTAASGAMQERAVLLVLLLGDPGPAPPPAQPGIVTLATQESAALRKRFHIAPDEFRVVLLGKDGGSKLASGKPVPAAQLNNLIDGMPMRRQEMQQGNR